MSSSFRLIQDSIVEPALHYALEEAMMRLADCDPCYPPTLRLRRVRPSALVGYCERARDTVDLAAAARLGVQVMRRHNLGGTVYQDPASFMFTVLYRQGDFLGGRTDDEVYADFAALVCDFLSEFGVQGRMRGANDVVVGDRKIYGSSHTRLGEAESQTGTLLVGTDLGRIASVLRFLPAKYPDKGFTGFEQGLTTLSRKCGRPVSIAEAYDAFADTFRRHFGLQLRKERLRSAELREARRLRRLKYGRPEWTLGDDAAYQQLYVVKAARGLLSLRGCFGDTIGEAVLGGDVMLSDREALQRVGERIRGLSYPDARSIVARSALPADVREGLIDLIARAERSRSGSSHVPRA